MQFIFPKDISCLALYGQQILVGSLQCWEALVPPAMCAVTPKTNIVSIILKEFAGHLCTIGMNMIVIMFKATVRLRCMQDSGYNAV